MSDISRLNGKVKFYDEDRGYGFIKAEDEGEYFFHVSSVLTEQGVKVGSVVTFRPKKTHKGIQAEDLVCKTEADTIRRQAKRSDAQFIIIDDTRIKLSNIKHYGLSREKVYYLKAYEKEERPRGALVNFIVGPQYQYVYNGKNAKITKEIAAKVGKGTKRLLYLKKGETYIENMPIYSPEGYTPEESIAPKEGFYADYGKSTSTDLVVKTVQYLYVSTYQNDNYKFYEEDVDIVAECQKLDDYFSL